MALNIAETIENIVNELKRLQDVEKDYEKLQKTVSDMLQIVIKSEQQIAEALRKHGLTLVKTAAGYDVMKLGEIVAQQEPVAFLANGTRFKISYDNRQSGGQIHGIPPELGGRWVAFVAADDDCHLKLTSPPQRTWFGLSDEEKRQLFDREDYQGWLDYINAIEAKLKEKNT